MQILKKLFPNLEKTLFFLVILFLPTQLGKHFWPQSSSIFSIRIDYLSPTIYFWDLLMLSLFTIFIINSYQKRHLTINKPFLYLAGFFLLTQGLSIIFAINPEGSLVRLKDYFIASLLGLYISSIDFTKNKSLFFSSLALSSVLTSFLAISQFLLGRSIGLWIIGERTFDVAQPLIAKFNFYEQVFLRPYATFPHPNMLAAFLVLILPLLNYGLTEKLKTFKLFNSLLTATTIFITFSRPALLLISFQIILIFRRFWKLLLIAGVLIFPLTFVRLSSIFTYDSLAILRRRELTDYALKIFPENPVFGVGLNNFINTLASNHVLIGTSRFLQPVHNIFLFTLAETGLVGLIGLLALLGFSILQTLKNQSPLSKVLLGNLIMIIFLGLFDHYFLTLPQGQRLLFLIIGLCFIAKESKSIVPKVLAGQRSNKSN